MKILENLLPDKNLLQLESCNLDEEQGIVKLLVSSIQTSAKCPVCNSPTHKIHSHYERKLADLSWANYSTSIELRVRKFFCINTECKRRIFTERLASIVLPWARRTTRFASQLTAIALANGGAAGVRLSQRLGFNISRNTLLNLVRRIPLPLFDSLKIVGVDDFCFRKCKTYGTIVVDLEKNRPVTLLKDRSAETLSSWLKEHPGIEVVSRDRAKAYEKGIKEGAPNAIQVADRFHLLQNLAQTLYEMFGIYSKDLKEVEQVYNQASVIKDEENIVVATYPSEAQPPVKQKQKAEQRRAKRKENHQKTWELHSQGMNAGVIAQKLGISRTTVFRNLRNPTFIERRGRSDKGRTLVSSYQDYIIKRWNEGCRETKIIFEEIKQQGYSGSYATVTRYTARLRECQGLKKRQRYSTKRLPKIIKPSQKILTPYSATWLILGSSNIDISESERDEIIMSLKTKNPSLKEGIELALNFISLVNQKNQKN